MTFDLTKFLQELALLALVGGITATLFSVLVKDRWLALFLASGFSTLALNLWAYFSRGGFDIPFLIQVIVVSSSTAILVISIVDAMRGRPAAA